MTEEVIEPTQVELDDLEVERLEEEARIESERLAEVAPFCIVKMDDGSSINLHKGMLTPEVISELKSIAADQSVLNLVEDTSEENID